MCLRLLPTIHFMSFSIWQNIASNDITPSSHVYVLGFPNNTKCFEALPLKSITTTVLSLRYTYKYLLVYVFKKVKIYLTTLSFFQFRIHITYTIFFFLNISEYFQLFWNIYKGQD